MQKSLTIFDKNIAGPILFTHFFIWAIVPTLLAPNLPLDAIESAYWAKEWQLGYFKHPPLNAWLAEIAITLFGRHDAVLFFLSSFCGLITIWPVILMTESRYGKKASNYTAIASLVILFLSISVYEYNVNMSFIPFWTWSIYAFIKAIHSSKQYWWVIFGVLSGFGFLGKYAILLLLFSLFLWCLFYQREVFKKSGAYIAMFIFCIVITPHIIWLIQNDYPTINYFLNRSSSGVRGSWLDHLSLPLGFFGNFLTNILPVIVAIIIGLGLSGFRSFIQSCARLKNTASQDALIFSTIISIIILCVISSLTASRIKVMWTMPIGYCSAGLFGIMLAQLDSVKFFRKRFLISTLVLYSLLITVMISVFFISPYTLKKPHRLMYDGKKLAQLADTYWKKHEGEKPLTTITGSLWPAGNIAWYHNDRPSIFINGDHKRSPWINLTSYKTHDQLYVSHREIHEKKIHLGLCATAVKQLDWPTAGSITYKNHPKIWFSILKPINNSLCTDDKK